MAIGVGEGHPLGTDAAPAAPAAGAVDPEVLRAEEGGLGDSEAEETSKKNNKRKKKKKKNKKKTVGSISQLADVQIYGGVKDLGTFQVTQDAVSGRCVVAARDLQAGELVLHEPPFAKVSCWCGYGIVKHDGVHLKARG